MPSQPEPFEVVVNQPFHLSGEAEQYEIGRFASCAEAVAVCEKVVDEFLASRQGRVRSAEGLFRLWRDEGPEPFVVVGEGVTTECGFSAEEHAEARCRELFGGGSGGGSGRAGRLWGLALAMACIAGIAVGIELLRGDRWTGRGSG